MDTSFVHLQYLPTTGSMTVFFLARSAFSHVSITSVSVELVGTPTVILLMITLTPFLSEVSTSTENILESGTRRIVNGESVDVNDKLNLSSLFVQTSVFESPVVQVQVTASPGHTVCLSHITEAASIN